jgi:hypothetical protein
VDKALELELAVDPNAVALMIPTRSKPQGYVSVSDDGERLADAAEGALIAAIAWRSAGLHDVDSFFWIRRQRGARRKRRALRVAGVREFALLRARLFVDVRFAAAVAVTPHVRAALGYSDLRASVREWHVDGVARIFGARLADGVVVDARNPPAAEQGSR